MIRLKNSMIDLPNLPNINFNQEYTVQQAFDHVTYGPLLRKNFYENASSLKLNVIHQPTNIEALIVSHKNNKHLYLTRKVKVSYHDQHEKTLIYHILLNHLLDEILQISVFEKIHEDVKLLMSDHAKKTPLSLQQTVYNFLENSSLQITVHILKKEFSTILEIEDKNSASIFKYFNTQQIENSLFQLKGFLKLLCDKKNQSHTDYYSYCVLKILDDYARHSSRESLKKIFHDDIELIEMLLVYFFFYIPVDKSGHETRLFLEYIFSPIEENLQLHPLICSTDISGFYGFTLESGKNKELILRKWEVEKEHIAQDIEEGLKIINETKTLETTKARILLSIKTPFKDIKPIISGMRIQKPEGLYLELLTINPKLQFPYFDYNRWIVLDNGEIIETHTVSCFHPLLESISEISRTANFEISLDDSASESGCYTFYGIGRNRPKDQRLFHFHTIGNLQEFEINFSDKLKKSLELVRKGLQNLSSPPKWNRIIFKVLPTCSTSLDKIKHYLEQTMSQYIQEFKELHIEKVYVYFESLEGDVVVPYTFRASHLLFDLPIFAILPGDKGLHAYGLDSERKARLKKAAQRGHSWAYDISRILDDASKRIRNEWNGQKQVEELFLPLQMVPDSTRMDPKTGLLDPEYGELMLMPHHSGSWITEDIARHGVIVGIKINDLGHGLQIKRLMLIADMTQSSTITCEQCTYINAALRYARQSKLSIDWFPGSYGTTIAMDTGVEHLDGCASTAKEIILTAIDAQIPINVIVDNVNVGAQAYWDALAAIIPKTSGIVIMTKRGSMALTGDKALTSVLNRSLTSAEIAIKSRQFFPHGTYDMGGYETIYGPNGNATAFVENLVEASVLLLKHHAFYDYEKISILNDSSMSEPEIVSLEKFIKEIQTGHAVDQKELLRLFQDADCFEGVYLWKDKKNIYAPQSDILHIHQHPSTVIKEMTLGGFPVLVICPKVGALTNSDSEIIAKAINKASGHLPVVLLGSILGYYSDPGSMYEGQLNSGSTIVEAIVHFKGPLVFVNLGAMIGGICVTFSKKLNKNITVVAVEGSKFEVVGGDIAKKIIFKKDSDRRLAEEFDKLHDAYRALKVGATDYVVPPKQLKKTICDILSHHTVDLHPQAA